MKALSEIEIRKMARKGQTEKVRPVGKPIAPVSPEDKQVKATKEMLAVIKASNDKTDQMATLTYSMADVFLKAIESVKPVPIEKAKKVMEWEFVVTERTDGRIKRFTAKAVG